MSQETVVPETNVDIPNEPIAEQPQEAQEAVQEEATQVPLHALQNERRKRQEAEQKVQFYQQKEQQSAAPDESRYESATKEDLGKSEDVVIRKIEEKRWARENPELFQKINDDLPNFLKLRPNLASAIESSPNRYEEAWELMSKLSPKQMQQQQVAQKPKQEAPGSPSGMPKAAAMSETVDLMNMSDADFNKWRSQQRTKR